MIKITLSVKKEKLSLIKMFSVDDEVDYTGVIETLSSNVSILESIIKAIPNGN